MATALPSVDASSYQGLEDQELVARVQSGEAQALAELMGRYRGLTLGMALKMGRAFKEDADDLVQEALIGLFNAIHTYRPGAMWFSTYAWRCVRNSVANSVIRQVRLSADYVAVEFGSARSAEDDALDRVLLTDILRYAEHHLTDIECAALVGHMIGLDHALTARIVGTNRSSVLRAFRRAVRLINAFLATERGGRTP